MPGSTALTGKGQGYILLFHNSQPRSMKKSHLFNILLLAVASLLTFTACSDDEDDRPAKMQPMASGTFVDERDGESYGWARFGNLDWMTENFRYDAGSQSSVYLDADVYEKQRDNTDHLAKFGRLYTVAGAKEACPQGWRLPTDEDWQQLERHLGMSAATAQQRGWRGSIARNMLTTKDDSSAVNLLLGGYFTTHTIMSMPGWRHMSSMAYYWTDTHDADKGGEFYFYRRLLYNSDAVYRESTEPGNYQMSVRYVRDAQ